MFWLSEKTSTVKAVRPERLSPVNSLFPHLREVSAVHPVTLKDVRLQYMHSNSVKAVKPETSSEINGLKLQDSFSNAVHPDIFKTERLLLLTASVVKAV